jgi:predicted O-methyltransferase YrrM
VHRGYSNLEVPKFEDAYFDIIYIDGNHNPEYVLEDAVLCFRKLKPNGMLIFDDYGWGGPDLTQKGINAFLSAYSKRISLIKIDPSSQVFIRKLR